MTGALVGAFPFAVAIGVSLAGRGAAARGTRTVLAVSLTLLPLGRSASFSARPSCCFSRADSLWAWAPVGSGLP